MFPGQTEQPSETTTLQTTEAKRREIVAVYDKLRSEGYNSRDAAAEAGYSYGSIMTWKAKFEGREYGKGLTKKKKKPKSYDLTRLPATLSPVPPTTTATALTTPEDEDVTVIILKGRAASVGRTLTKIYSENM